jgi:hypothetical protein
MSALATDIFGMPLVMQRADVDYAIDALERVWRVQAGRAPRDFDRDLERLADWFHPKLRGLTVRNALIALPPVEVGAAELPSLVLLPCADGRHLVSPEGRAWLECAHAARAEPADPVVFATESAVPFERKLLALYRAWSRHRINDVIEKLTGAGAPMLPVAIGIVLLLLVNRSLDTASAIRRVREPAAQQRIDDVIADVLEAFVDTLAGRGQRRREQFSLWSGYPLTEARRRLAGRLILEAEEGLVYIDGAREDEVIEFVARDLARRREATEQSVAAAFSALVGAYRARLEDLSGLGSGFERVGRTEALRDRLLSAVRQEN